MNLIVFASTQNLIYTNNKQQKYWKLICVSYAKRNIVKLEACLELCFFAHWNVKSNYNATGIIFWSTILREISLQCFWQNGFNLYGYCRLFCLNITFYLIRVMHETLQKIVLFHQNVGHNPIRIAILSLAGHMLLYHLHWRYSSCPLGYAELNI